MRFVKFLALAIMPLLTGSVAHASGIANPWQKNLQDAATPVMESIIDFHNLLLVVITLIVIVVLVLLAYTIWRFGEKRNPVPSQTTHHTMLEMVWTVVPVIILVLIAVPSFKLLYLSDVVPKADMTVKAIAHQWYWSYEYPDNGKFTFDATMIPDSDIKPGQHRLLETDTVVVVPVNTTVRVQVTSTDVLHSWAMPSFGVKVDAVPGRLNETWFKATREGTFYGQCSELCGVNHGFMPIKLQVVSKQAFDAWVGKQRRAAGIDSAPRTVAQSIVHNSNVNR
jgi:cytochrome c oxidase subunit II